MNTSVYMYVYYLCAHIHIRVWMCRGACMYTYVSGTTLYVALPPPIFTSWELWLSSSRTEWTSPCQLLMNASLPQWGQVDRPSASVAGQTAQRLVPSACSHQPRHCGPGNQRGTLQTRRSCWRAERSAEVPANSR